MPFPDTVNINFSYACFEVLVLLVLWCNDYLTISRRRRGDYKPIFTEPKANFYVSLINIFHIFQNLQQLIDILQQFITIILQE